MAAGASSNYGVMQYRNFYFLTRTIIGASSSLGRFWKWTKGCSGRIGRGTGPPPQSIHHFARGLATLISLPVVTGLFFRTVAALAKQYTGLGESLA